MAATRYAAVTPTPLRCAFMGPGADRACAANALKNSVFVDLFSYGPVGWAFQDSVETNHGFTLSPRRIEYM
jgi:hypothetical protein